MGGLCPPYKIHGGGILSTYAKFGSGDYVQGDFVLHSEMANLRNDPLKKNKD